MIHMFSVDYISRGLGNVIEKYSGVTDIKKKDIKEGAIIVQIRWLCTAPKIVGSIFENEYQFLDIESNSWRGLCFFTGNRTLWKLVCFWIFKGGKLISSSITKSLRSEDILRINISIVLPIEWDSYGQRVPKPYPMHKLMCTL